ncbi:MAG: 16S rRNA (cytosine(1402)-N(4))-methyltransferase RsmH [Nitrospirota bacterium]|jgi:16S rRNA (cytosine1402-N4)-methyltransferase
METPHLPVMLREAIGFLGLSPGGTYIDATVGLGGHAEEILRHIGPQGRLLGIDRDPEALKRARERLKDERAILVKARFSEMREAARENGIERADGVLFDFGVSMLQLRGEGRGFSFLSDEPLDMRMDPTEPLTAENVVNEYPEKELEKIISGFGEERRARRVARAIAAQRRKGRIRTCSELAGIVARALGGRRGRTHPATRTFQAFRIAVNDEMGEIRRGLEASLGMVRPGGRLVAISYHSLEDRIVKQFMKESKDGGRLNILTKKPLRPSSEEVTANPSARSARLRAGEVV